MGKILRTVLLFMSFLVCARVMAQNQGTVVKGTVTDDKGVTMPGVTVTVKGTTSKTVTNVSGVYTIQVPPASKSLVFSFIGMEAQEVAIGNKSLINVAMAYTSTTLSDVVVIGYGTQRRGDVNGAIGSITSKDIKDIPQASVDQMLQGKVAGVNVTDNSGQPGSNTSVHIRGITSFTASEPLYVIDGVEIQGNSPGGQLNSPTNGQQETSTSPLAMLNANDIASIDILKDASATKRVNPK